MQPFTTLSLLSALLLLQAGLVLGHGYVSKVTIGGKSYTGLAPFEGGARGSSAIRQIQSTSPVMPASNPNLACGSSNSPASLIADAQPGDTVSFKWVGQGGINWIHKVGPILTYMASCGTSPCSQFDASSAQWFKISELTKKPSGEWYMADVFAGGETTSRIPPTLKAGHYLIRSELIAIHNAVTQGGAEYFPSCTQLRVGGSQSGVPAQGDLVKFPGAYKDSDPGVFVPDLFQPGFKYTAPGPAVAKIAKGNGGGGGESSPEPSSTKGASTSTRTPSSSTSAKPSASSTAVPDVPAPVGNVAPKPPSSSSSSVTPTSSALQTAPSPVTTRVCKRKRSSLKYMQAKQNTKREVVPAASPSPVPAPAVVPKRKYGRHSRRGLRSRLEHGHGSHAVL